MVAGLNGEEYGSVWRTRFFSNVLTELTFVPSLLPSSTSCRNGSARHPRRRQLEALLLGLGLMLACFGVFGGLLNAGGPFPISANTPLAFLLPFLLWAAVRFGPGGASLALLITRRPGHVDRHPGRRSLRRAEPGRGGARVPGLPELAGDPAPLPGRGGEGACGSPTSGWPSDCA